LQRNDLRPVYRAIKQMRGGCERVQETTVPISKNDGTPCVSVDEVLDRWNKHYQQMQNYAPASSCPELDDAAANAAPAGDVRDDAPTLDRGGPEGDQKTSKWSSGTSRRDHSRASENCRDTD